MSIGLGEPVSLQFVLDHTSHTEVFPDETKHEFLRFQFDLESMRGNSVNVFISRVSEEGVYFLSDTGFPCATANRQWDGGLAATDLLVVPPKLAEILTVDNERAVVQDRLLRIANGDIRFPASTCKCVIPKALYRPSLGRALRELGLDAIASQRSFALPAKTFPVPWRINLCLFMIKHIVSDDPDRAAWTAALDNLIAINPVLRDLTDQCRKRRKPALEEADSHLPPPPPVMIQHHPAAESPDALSASLEREMGLLRQNLIQMVEREVDATRRFLAAQLFK